MRQQSDPQYSNRNPPPWSITSCLSLLDLILYRIKWCPRFPVQTVSVRSELCVFYHRSWKIDFLTVVWMSDLFGEMFWVHILWGFLPFGLLPRKRSHREWNTSGILPASTPKPLALIPNQPNSPWSYTWVIPLKWIRFLQCDQEKKIVIQVS